MYRGAQTTTLLRGEGERGKIKADRVNCPKNFVLHCSLGFMTAQYASSGV